MKIYNMVSKNQELKWQAESDASTMATYQEIMSDKARMRRAINVAKAKAADLSKRANAMQNVARTKSSSKRK
jgi:DNA polymerase III delta prime subunit